MKKQLLSAMLATSMMFAAAPLSADVYEDDSAKLKEFIDEVWAWSLSEAPVFATSLGVRDYDNQVADISLEAQDKSADKANAFLMQLRHIDKSKLSANDKVNLMLLQRQLGDQVERHSFGQRMMLFTNRGGWHQNFVSMADNLPFRTKADYQSYNNRLKQYPKINDEAIKISNMAVAKGYTLPCVAMVNFENGIKGVITEDPKKSRFYKPYTRNKPANMSDKEWSGLALQASMTISQLLNPAYQKHHDWYVSKYKPNCNTSPSVAAQPEGDKYYQFRVRQMTTTDKSADEIHKIGLSEVARIKAEMEQVAKEAGFASRDAFKEDLRTNPKYYAKTPEELMEKVSRVTKIIDGKMPSLFRKLPRLPYGLREIPAEIAEGTTTAYYGPGSPQIGIAGTYYVNTSKLDQRPFWEIPALSVHEAVPGHHQQIALQQELDVPDFRKYGAFFTAFVEGWGLYSERLGIEMGLYDTPAKNMGRLSYEMWRACRLVVDTGIHSKGWTKQQAIDFMTENTALTAANIEAEVNRYISWPGQALAYKMGELKIRELRALAEKELGDKFDLRDFHDTVLGQGAVPLGILETQVKDWIAATKG